MNANKQVPVAIVGYGFRLPGGLETEDEFWQLLKEREIVQVDFRERFDGGLAPMAQSKSSSSSNTTRPGHPIKFASKNLGLITGEKERLFDPKFFAIPPTEAARMDPQIRMLLLTSWEAMERAGQNLDELRGSNVGVFVGSQGFETLNYRPLAGSASDAVPGHSLSMLANRISYHMNLTGPSATYCTACSASATALHALMASVTSGECSTAILGGSSYMGNTTTTAGFGNLGVLNSEGLCRSFDDSADGYMRSEGCFSFVLKRLDVAESEGDHIYGVIKGVHVNSAGPEPGSSGLTAGRYITAPTVLGQMECMEAAYRRSGVSPASVAYLEAHATGTKLGDKQELTAIGTFFKKGGGREQAAPLRLASVKSNIGHMEAASFTCALLKVCLMLHRREFLPTSKTFVRPNTAVDIKGLGLEIQTRAEPFPASASTYSPVVIGINSFGFGGANAHVIVEEYLAHAKQRYSGQPSCLSGGERAYLLQLSAKNHQELRKTAAGLARCLEPEQGAALTAAGMDLYALAGNLARRRTHYDARVGSVCCTSLEGARAKLLDVADSDEKSAGNGSSNAPMLDRPAKLLFVFPGQGSQWIGMGLQLYLTEPAFRAAIDTIDNVWRTLSGGSSLKELIFQQREGAQKELDQCKNAQPALFMIQAALFETLLGLGVQPLAVVGHSAGEVAAAYACRALDLETAIRVVFERSRLQQSREGSGRMLAVGLPAKDTVQLLGELELDGSLNIACTNSPSSCVVCGEEERLLRLMSRFEADKTFHRLIPGGIAFHSPAMDPIQHQIMEALSFLSPSSTSPSECEWVSSVTGDQVRCADAAYWWSNVRQPVNFLGAMSTVLQRHQFDAIIEVSPHITLRSPVRQCFEVLNPPLKVEPKYIPTLIRHEHDGERLMGTLGTLFEMGVELQYGKQCFPRPRPLTHLLPTYPFHLALPEKELENDFVFFSRKGPLSAGPLLGERILTSSPGMLFTNPLSGEHYPYLMDHVVQGVSIYPAAGFVETVLETAGGILPCRIRDAKIAAGLAIPPRQTDFALVSVKVERDFSDGDVQDRRRVVVSSAAGTEPTCTTHFVCSIESGLKIDFDSFSLSSLPEGVPSRAPLVNGMMGLPPSEFRVEYADGDAFYNHIEEVNFGGYRYGPSFRPIKRCYAKPDNSQRWIEMEMDEALFQSGDEEGILLHPAMMDGALQTFILTGLGLGAYGTGVPSGIKQLTVLRKMKSNRAVALLLPPDESSLHPVLKGCIGEGVLDLGSVFLYDAVDGELLVALQGYEGFTHDKLLSDEFHKAKFWTAWQPMAAPRVNASSWNWKSNCEEVVAQILQSMWGAQPGRLIRFLQRVSEPSAFIGEALARLVGPEKCASQLECFVVSNSAATLRFLNEKYADSSTVILRLQELQEDGMLSPESSFVRPSMMDLILLDGKSDENVALSSLSHVLLPEGLALLPAEVNSGQLPGNFDWVVPPWAHDSNSDALHRCPFNLARCSGLPPLSMASDDGLSGGGVVVDLVFPDSEGVAISLSRAIARERGCQGQIVVAHAEGGRIPFGHDEMKMWGVSQQNTVSVKGSWTEEGALARLLDGFGDSVETITFGLGIDAHNLEDFGAEAFAILMELCRALFGQFVSGARSHTITLRVVTKCAVGPHCSRPHSSSLWGATRTAALETSLSAGLNFRLVDADGISSLESLASAIARGCEEDEICSLRGELFVPRFIRCTKKFASLAPHRLEGADSPAYNLVVGDYRQISGLHYSTRELPDVASSADLVEVEVRASALNFRDIMVALDQLPPISYERSALGRNLGMECTGRVICVGSNVSSVSVGDEVLVSQGGCLANRIVAHEWTVFKRPANVSLDELAGIYSVYTTAWYALQWNARLRAGQSILVHSALGGVGQSAIFIARHLGLRVYATAGTQEKRERLVQMGCIAAFNSRDLTWFNHLQVATEGEGVDCVLNSLAGDHIPLGIRSLKACGHFCEIGKTDIFQDKALNLLAFRKNIRYAAIDMDRLALDAPEVCLEVAREVLSLLERGSVPPIPITTYSFGDASCAIRDMMRGDHTGKLVLINEYYRGSRPEKPLCVRDHTPLFSSTGTYIFTGSTALDGFGMRVLLWAAWRGAQTLLLMDRDPEQRRTPGMIKERSGIQRLFPKVQVHTVQGDASKLDDVRRAFLSVDEMGLPPVRGVVHLAGVLKDCSILRLSKDVADIPNAVQDAVTYDVVSQPKAVGALHLHRVSLELGCDLDSFILLSSTSNILGNPGQANYSAANSFLEGLVNMRRAMGLAGAAFHMHGVTNTGMASRTPHVLKHMRLNGMPGMTDTFAMHGLDAQVRENQPHLVMVRVHKVPLEPGEFNFKKIISLASNFDANSSRSVEGEETLEAILSRIAAKLAEVLDIPQEDIDVDERLANYGVSSMVSVELTAFLRSSFGYTASSVEIATKATCRSLAASVLNKNATVLDCQASNSEHKSTDLPTEDDFAAQYKTRTSAFSISASDHFPVSDLELPTPPPSLAQEPPETLTDLSQAFRNASLESSDSEIYCFEPEGTMPWILQNDISELRSYVDEISEHAQAGAAASEFRCVLLTGATGFLGAHVLSRLLSKSPAIEQVICLVRADDEEHALCRVRKALTKLLIWDEAFAARITCLPGDTGAANIGLSRETFASLCETVDAVYHLAACVNLQCPYAEIRESNSVSIRSLLRLCVSSKYKHLIVGSTLGLFPAYQSGFSGAYSAASIGREAMPCMNDMVEKFPLSLLGYIYSKLALEQVCLYAAARASGMPLAIMRIPLIGHNSRTGAVQDNVASAFIAAVTQVGAYAPELCLARVNPVCRISDDLVDISLNDRREGKIYHLFHSHGGNPIDLFELELRKYGFNPNVVSFDEFRARCQALGTESALDKQWPYLNMVLRLVDASKVGYADVDRSTATNSLQRPDFGMGEEVSLNFRVLLWIDGNPEWPMKMQRPTLNYTDVVCTASSLLGWNAEDAMPPAVQEGLMRIIDLFNAGDASSRSTSWAYFARRKIQDDLMMRCKNWEFLRSSQYCNAVSTGGGSVVERPIFIVGLNRSGTTFLHRLLVQKQESFMTTLGYETQSSHWDLDGLFDPAALTSPEHSEDPRHTLAMQNSALEHFRKYAEAHGIFDHTDLTAPEEDFNLFEQSFLSPSWAYIAPIEGREAYTSFLLGAGELDAFRHHKECLQVLAWQKGHTGGTKGRRWLLKNPLHSGFMDDLFTVYPDATVIHCHRDPVPQMDSWVDLNATLLEACLFETGKEQQHAVNLDALAAIELAFMSSATDRLVEFRLTHPELSGQFIDVNFESLIADPVKTAEGILAAVGVDTDAGTKKKMAAFVKDYAQSNKKRKQAGGEQLCGAARFGLSESKIRSAFVNYIDFMPKPSKKGMVVKKGMAVKKRLSRWMKRRSAKRD